MRQAQQFEGVRVYYDEIQNIIIMAFWRIMPDVRGPRLFFQKSENSSTCDQRSEIPASFIFLGKI
jgi:hypothetical protein